MARYIDAEFVSDGLREVLHRPKSEFPDDFEQAINCLVYAISILKFAPTADVAPVIHAHWIEDGDTDICSNCEERFSPAISGLQLDRILKEGKTYWNYCPNCGAKMDEQKEG